MEAHHTYLGAGSLEMRYRFWLDQALSVVVVEEADWAEEHCWSSTVVETAGALEVVEEQAVVVHVVAVELAASQ